MWYHNNIMKNNESFNLKKLIAGGTHREKTYINKIVDVLIPSEIIEPLIPILLKEVTSENLYKILKINQNLKSYLIYHFSNVESLIDTWAHIMCRDNKYFKTKMKNMDKSIIKEHIAGSSNKVKQLKNKLKDNDSIYKSIVDGTLGRKLSILSSIDPKYFKWFFKTKKGKSDDALQELFISYLKTCLKLRNMVTHESFIIDEKLWSNIYKESINKRINADIDNKKIKTMTKEIFEEVSKILKKADYNNIKERMTKYLKRDLLERDETWASYTKGISIDFLLK